MTTVTETTPKTRIALAMIVRDAEHTVERAIRSALPLISRWTVIDTGSVDNTRQVVTDTLAGLPGQLLESEWKGHAHNRSELLAIARHGADYVLMLDADMEVLLEGELPELTAASYLLTIRDRGLDYPLPLLTRTKYDWYYAGVAHSYLACRDAEGDAEKLSQLVLLDHGGGGSRPGKLERDRDLLALQVARDPTDARSWFYLGQSFRDLDEIEPAIAAYKRCAEISQWDEQTYYALYQAGTLLCEHVNYHEGARLLLDAFRLRPSRAEALRALAGSTASVADKIPYPEHDVLFVRRGAYKEPEKPVEAPAEVPPAEVPPVPPLLPTEAPYRLRKKRDLNDVTAVIVTRGDVDLAPCLEPLPYKNVIVWNNAERTNYKAFGRYAALAEITTPLVYWQDDDVIPDHAVHKALLDEYEHGRYVCNMDQQWIDGAGYGDFVSMQGAGSLCSYNLPMQIFTWYLRHHPWDDDAITEADFIFGVLAPFKRINVPYTVREFADDPTRLYTQPGQTERKWMMIERCREIIRRDGATGWQGVAA